MKTLRAAVVALMATLLYAAPASAEPTAIITESFADGCRDFSAHSTKDISHVVLHYTDGRVGKDETIATPDYSIDGAAGDEIDVVVVKSGTTSKTFRCDLGTAPVAALEIRLSPYCQPSTSGTGEPVYWCRDGANNTQRTVFVDPGDLDIDMGCLPTETLCLTLTVRGTGSTDPDGDITGWSIAFGDGAVASGDWTAMPPQEVTHEFAADGPCAVGSGYCAIMLTVTDSQGRTDSDSIEVAFYDITPD